MNRTAYMRRYFQRHRAQLISRAKRRYRAKVTAKFYPRADLPQPETSVAATTANSIY